MSTDRNRNYYFLRGTIDPREITYYLLLYPSGVIGAGVTPFYTIRIRMRIRVYMREGGE